MQNTRLCSRRHFLQASSFSLGSLALAYLCLLYTSPPGLIDSLQFVDKRSLFAFLGQLGRPGPFDASKGNVARVWWLYGAADFSKATKAEKLDEAVPTYSLVDGKLVRELLKVNADLVAKNGGDIYAVARFEACLLYTSRCV